MSRGVFIPRREMPAPATICDMERTQQSPAVAVRRCVRDAIRARHIKAGGYSQEQLAEALNLARGTVAGWLGPNSTEAIPSKHYTGIEAELGLPEGELERIEQREAVSMDGDRLRVPEATEALVNELLERFESVEQMLGVYLDGDPIPIAEADAQALERALGRRRREGRRDSSSPQRRDTA